MKLNKRYLNNKLIYKVAAFILALLLFAMPISAATEIEDVPYSSYTYWNGPSSYTAVPMRSVYNATTSFTGEDLGTTSLSDANYIILSPDKSTLYIVDSGNSRILVVDAVKLNLLYEIGEITKGDEVLNYTGANGLYVSSKGIMYICDTENARVIITDTKGNYKGIIEAPTDNGVPSDLDFRPSRIVEDSKGYLYIVSKGCYYGLLAYDDELNFLGFHGAYTVETSVISSIKSWITNLFMTNEKNNSGQKKLPSEISDITINNDGFLYTLSGGSSGQVKRLGLSGTQTLDYKFSFDTKGGDSVNFGETPSSFWHKHFQYSLIFSGITTDEDGFFYIVDSGRSRIFMYDEDCRLITAFSNGYSVGDQVGTFITPTSIAAGNDKLYVLDFVYGSVTVFDLTEYGKMYKQADLLTAKGEYDEAQPIWEDILKLDANNQHAYEGLGKAYLNNDDYTNAMTYSKKAYDQQTYSLAFKQVQKQFLSKNFWWIFILCVGAVGAIAYFISASKKRKLITIKNQKLHAAVTTPIHPIAAFQSVKYKKNSSVLIAVIILALFYIASVCEDLYGGFMYVIVDASEYNSLYTLLGSVGLVLLWVIANWGICILSDGKGTLKEVFVSSCYCLTPMIVYSVVFIVGSHFIASSGTDSFSIISTIALIYTILLLLLSMTVVHEYSFFKACGMAILTLLGMILVAFIVFSLWLLAQQFVMFIINIVQEAVLR